MALKRHERHERQAEVARHQALTQRPHIEVLERNPVNEWMRHDDGESKDDIYGKLAGLRACSSGSRDLFDPFSAFSLVRRHCRTAQFIFGRRFSIWLLRGRPGTEFTEALMESGLWLQRRRALRNYHERAGHLAPSSSSRSHAWRALRPWASRMHPLVNLLGRPRPSKPLQVVPPPVSASVPTARPIAPSRMHPLVSLLRLPTKPLVPPPPVSALPASGCAPPARPIAIRPDMRGWHAPSRPSTSTAWLGPRIGSTAVPGPSFPFVYASPFAPPEPP